MTEESKPNGDCKKCAYNTLRSVLELVKCNDEESRKIAIEIMEMMVNNENVSKVRSV